MATEKPEYTYQSYIDGVLNGSIVVCKPIRQAVERFVRMCNDPRYDFRPEMGEKVIDFFYILRHFEGKHNNKRFILSSWQQLFLMQIFSLYIKGTDTRLINKVILSISRKNGKTALVAGIALYLLLFSASLGDSSCEIDLTANSREQAKLLLKFVQGFCAKLDAKQRILQPYRDKVKLVKGLGVAQVFSSDTSKLDGYNASLWCNDETSSATNRKMLDVLQSSQGMRPNPLGMMLSTTGFDKTSPFYEEWQIALEILSGLKEDDHTAAFIFTLDEGDRWDDPDVWIKSNPNLCVTINPAYLETQIAQAKNSPSLEVGVKTKNLNLWCDSAETWIPDNYILDASKNIKLEDYAKMPAWVGLDLSSTTDLTALAVCIPLDDGKFAFFTRCYLPNESMDKNPAYHEYRRKGELVATDGNVCDYQYVLNDLVRISKIVDVMAIAYDSWNSTQLIIEATNIGLPCVPFSQSLGHFNKATKCMEMLLLSGNAILENSSLLRASFSNVVLVHDHNGNSKPSKAYQASAKKIDPVISCLEALGSFLETPQYGDIY